MPNSKKRTTMVFKIAPEKFSELTSYVDWDKKYLTVFSPINRVTCGAIFQDKTCLESMFEEFENAS